MPEPRLRPLERRLVGVALAGAPWIAGTGLPEVLTCCSHHEKSLRQVLFGGSGFRAGRSLIGTLHAERSMSMGKEEEA